MKRATPEDVKKYGTSVALTTETDGHQHGIDSYERGCDCGCVNLTIDYSSDTDGNSHSHPITLEPLAIGASIGHSHDIDASLVVKTHNGGPHMVTKNDDTTTTTDEPTLETVQAENQRLTAIVGLSTEERAHFDALPDDMRSTFLGKSAADRRAEIVAKNDADPVVYTTTDGVEIRKSAGEAMIAIAKSNDELRKANDSLVKAREQDALEKRADVELSHLPGDLQSRAALLKAAESIPDEKQRDTALAALKSQNNTAKGAYRTLGHGGGLGEPSSDEDSLDKMAKSIAEKEGITYHQAYAKAITSPEGREIYAKSLDPTTT